MSQRVPTAGKSAKTRKTNNARGVVTPVEQELDEILGPPPLFRGERELEYRSLIDRFRTYVKPADIIEEAWLRDVVNLVWDIRRLRRHKAGLTDASMRQGVESALEDLGADFSQSKKLAEGWARRLPLETGEVDVRLYQAGHGMYVVEARALQWRLDDFERIDNMLMKAEARRDAVLREIDRHRDAVARRLREAAADVQDAEFQDIGTSDANAAESIEVGNGEGDTVASVEAAKPDEKAAE